jgi:hypothetical protein
MNNKVIPAIILGSFIALGLMGASWLQRWTFVISDENTGYLINKATGKMVQIYQRSEVPLNGDF